MAQADGYYPRLNAAMLQSGNFTDMIVSVVGKVKSKDMANDQLEFECSDGGVVWMDSSQADAEILEAFMNFDSAPVMEAIGSVGENNIVTLFVTRELSEDTNMDVYNKMLAVQHNPKFASYFAPVTGDSMVGQGQ